MRKNKFIIVMIFCIILSISSCTSNNLENNINTSSQENIEKNDVSSNEKRKVDVLVIGTTAENNVFSSMSQKDAFGRMNYNGLTQGDFVYVDENDEIAPYFFKTLDISEDGKTAIFTFPDDAIWHDNQPVTEEDILFTFDYMKNVKKSSGLKNLEKCEITGENECTLTFSEPDAFYFFNASASNNACVYAKHIWEGIEDYSEYRGEDAAIGCGPFKLVSKDIDSQTSVYEAVPENNFLGDIMVDKVIVQTYSGEDTLMMAMANGEIDAMFNYARPIDVTLIETFEGTPGMNMGESEFGGHYQLTYGMRSNPINDINMRKAIRSSLDYEKLAYTINGKYGEIPKTGIINSITKGYNDKLPQLETDIDEANRILDESGYIDIDGDGIRELPDGSKMSIKITQQYSKNKEILNRITEVIMSSLKDVGIDTHIDEESLANSEVWEANVSKGNYDLSIGFCTSGMTNWSSAFRYFISKPKYEGEETWLWGTYDNDQFHEVFYKMQQSKTNEEYAMYMKELQDMADQDIFAQALCWQTCHFPYRTDKIFGWEYFPGWGVINSRTWFDIYEK